MVLPMSSDEMYHMLEERIDGYKKIETRRKDADQRKTLDETFDHATLLCLYKLITNGIIDTLDYPISTGKEGNVYHATDPEGAPLAVKIYRTSTATFKNIMKYIDGNPRYRNIGRKRRQIIFTWAKKEYNNLARLTKYDIRVPRPIHVVKNILVMEYIGSDIRAAPLLKNVVLDEPDTCYNHIIEEYFKIFNHAKMVHADLSEYNVLITDEGELVIIDLGQCVVLEHPEAYNWFVRDIKNISNFFSKRGVHIDWKQAGRYIRRGEEGGFSEFLDKEVSLDAVSKDTQ